MKIISLSDEINVNFYTASGLTEAVLEWHLDINLVTGNIPLLRLSHPLTISLWVSLGVFQIVTFLHISLGISLSILGNIWSAFKAPQKFGFFEEFLNFKN